MMRDPCLLPHHLHLPTAYIYLQFAPRHILFYEHRHSKLAFSVPAPLCYPQHKCATVCTCASLFTHKKLITKNSRTAGVKWTPGAAAMPERGIFPVTKKNGSQQSVTHIMFPYIHLVR